MRILKWCALLAVLCVMTVSCPAFAEVSNYPVLVEAIKLNPITTIEPHQEVSLSYTFVPANTTDRKVSFTSSRTSVATVSKSGVITAKRPGTTTITVKTKQGGKKDSFVLNVAFAATPTRYYFFGIANSNYKKLSALPACANDLKLMESTFERANFAGTSVSLRTAQDLTGGEMYQFLKSIGDDTRITSKDVTIFYYSGHGGDAADSNKQLRGALIGVDQDYVTVDDVQQMLDRVPGQVVVILDSCLSGQFIQSKGLSADSIAEQFNQSVVATFQRGAMTTKALPDSKTSSKYKLITACQPLELSWCFTFGKKPYGLMTYYLGKGLGKSLPADSNKDKRVTINELYKYASTQVSKTIKSYNKSSRSKLAQHVTVWPTGDKSYIFAADPT